MSIMRASGSPYPERETGEAPGSDRLDEEHPACAGCSSSRLMVRPGVKGVISSVDVRQA